VLRTDFAIQYGDSFSGDVDVVELFTELDIPIVDRFGVNVAARKSEYDNTAGAGTGVEGQTFDYDIDTWKFTGNWDVIDPLRIRFSQSRDVRAPNFRELYYRQFIHAGGTFGFCTTAGGTQPWVQTSTDACNFDLRGGLQLQPEEADTTTLGFVVSPQGLDLRFAVDLFQIEIDRAITPASTALVVASCFNGDQAFCNQITGTTFIPPSGCRATCFSDIDTIVATAFNYRTYEFTGADFTADWIKALPAGGQFALRFLASRAFHQNIQTSTTNTALIEDIAGVTGAPTSFLSDWASAADLTANLTASWSRDKFTVTGQAQYISDGINDRQQRGPEQDGYNPAVTPPQTVNTNSVPSYAILSVSGTYDFELAGGNTLQLWGSVNNLGDRDPPLVGGGVGFQSASVGGAQAQFFDTLGRTYRVGVRLSF
jgi:outer membrane receptor protein involved in Fe transport